MYTEYEYIHIHKHTHTYTHMCIYIYTYTCTGIWNIPCTYRCVYIYIYIHVGLAHWIIQHFCLNYDRPLWKLTCPVGGIPPAKTMYADVMARLQFIWTYGFKKTQDEVWVWTTNRGLDILLHLFTMEKWTLRAGKMRKKGTATGGETETRWRYKRIHTT